jgi:hypothetical protein
MAWFPGARKLEVQPESDTQSVIRPTQLILHSLAAPWNVDQTYNYWKNSTNLESHFAVAYDGDLGQFIGTQTRADANYQANLRPDGTGAVSCESEANVHNTDPWTQAQMNSLIRLGVWLHKEHDIPLRVCRSWTDPGYGYHRMFPQWALGGSTFCPGDARAAQFHNIVFPGIVSAANGDPLPQHRGEHNATNVAMKSGTWKTLEFESKAIATGAGIYDVMVNLTLEGLAPGATVQGRFYHLNGKDRTYGPIIERFASDGQTFADFNKCGQMGSGDTLHFQLAAWNKDGAPFTVAYRVVEGLGWAL